MAEDRDEQEVAATIEFKLGLTFSIEIPMADLLVEGGVDDFKDHVRQLLEEEMTKLDPMRIERKKTPQSQPGPEFPVPQEKK